MIKSRYTPYIAGEKNAACPTTQTAGLCGKLLVTSLGRRLRNTTSCAVKILFNQVLSIYRESVSKKVSLYLFIIIDYRLWR